MDFPILPSFIAALLAGYLLGSIPFALLAGKFRGVDVFRTGSRSAGTANVFWNIGRRVAIAVLAGDVAKGSAAVLFAQFLGLPWPLVLVVGGAVVLGHWNSVFSRFKGGDGMAALMGVTVTLEPVLAVLGAIAGACVLLLLWHASLRRWPSASWSFWPRAGFTSRTWAWPWVLWPWEHWSSFIALSSTGEEATTSKTRMRWPRTWTLPKNQTWGSLPLTMVDRPTPSHQPSGRGSPCLINPGTTIYNEYILGDWRRDNS